MSKTEPTPDVISNICRPILGDEYDAVKEKGLPDDIGDTLDHLLSTSMNERAREIFIRRMSGSLIKDIAEDFGLSKSRTREIIVRATDKVQSRDSKEMVRLGMARYKDEFLNAQDPNITSIPIDCLGLRPRTRNALHRAKCMTVADTIKLIKEGKLSRVRDIGTSAANEIKEKCQPYMRQAS